MDDTRRPIPLRDRPGDWFFILAFGFFAFSSFFSDIYCALRVHLTPDSPNFWVRANYWYADKTDPLLLALPTFLWLQTFISAFVFGPFYLVLVYAVGRGRNWIRMPAIIYASVMTYAMAITLGVEYLGDLPPENDAKFLAFNLPYLVFPLILAWRMRRPHPFSAPAARADAPTPAARLAG